MKRKEVKHVTYETEDGKVFNSLHEAREHERKLLGDSINEKGISIPPYIVHVINEPSELGAFSNSRRAKNEEDKFVFEFEELEFPLYICEKQAESGKGKHSEFDLLSNVIKEQQELLESLMNVMNPEEEVEEEEVPAEEPKEIVEEVEEIEEEEEQPMGGAEPGQQMQLEEEIIEDEVVEEEEPKVEE